MEVAGGRVSKGAKPTRVRFGKVERNFKGDVNWRALEVAWKEVLERVRLAVRQDAGVT
jgi:hypothetical protein